MTIRLQLPLAALSLALCACGATPNRVPRAGAAPAVADDASAPTETPAAQTATEAAASDRAPNAQPAQTLAASQPAVELPDVTGGLGSASRIARFAGGQTPEAAELVRMWLHRESPAVFDYIEELVLARIIVAESARLGLSLPSELIDEEAEKSFQKAQEKVEQRSPGMTLDQFIELRLGLDPATYRQRMRDDRWLDLLAERCVRAWMLGSERTEVRLIVVDDPDDVDKVRERLERGDDFAAVAQDLSVEQSQIPPVVRTESPLARLAFATELGQWGGPLKEGDRYLFLIADARPAPQRGPWSQIGPAVEASLEARAIEDPEYWQWKGMMQLAYEVDLEPFFEMVGEQ